MMFDETSVRTVPQETFLCNMKNKVRLILKVRLIADADIHTKLAREIADILIVPTATNFAQ